MLATGAVDAAIVDPVPSDLRFVSVVAETDGAHRLWQQQWRARTINHVVVVRDRSRTIARRCPSCSGCFARAGAGGGRHGPGVGADRSRGEPAQPGSRHPSRGGRGCWRARSPSRISSPMPSPHSTSGPRFGDVAHVGHIELLTPGPTRASPSSPRSSGCTRPAVRARPVSARVGRLRAPHAQAHRAHHVGLGHLGLRVRDEPTLHRLVAQLETHRMRGSGCG